MSFIRKYKCKDGRMAFTAQVRIEGFPSVSKTFDSHDDAKAWRDYRTAALKSERRHQTRSLAEETLTDLYRMFDKEGKLLYIGISQNTAKRVSHHKRKNGALWMQEVVRTTVTQYPTRDSALRAEYWAILNESPLHNVQNNPVRSRRSAP